MSTKLRTHGKGAVVWILLGVLVLGLGGFGISNFSGGMRTIGSVGGTEVTSQDYARALRQQLNQIQQQTGRAVTMEQAKALSLHAKLWDIANGETLAHGGSIAHHHGSGLFRGPWMDGEHGEGMKMLRKIKAAIDPQNLFNPGKLGFATRAGAIDPYRDRPTND